MSEPTGWQSWSGSLDEAPPEIRAELEVHAQRVPLADIRVKVYDLAPGQSELQVWIAPDGAVHDAHSSGAARRAAYDALLACLQRELATTLPILGAAEPSA